MCPVGKGNGLLVDGSKPHPAAECLPHKRVFLGIQKRYRVCRVVAEGAALNIILDDAIPPIWLVIPAIIQTPQYQFFTKIHNRLSCCIIQRKVLLWQDAIRRKDCCTAGRALTFSIGSLTLFAMIIGQPIPFEARTKLRIPLASASVQAGFPSPAEDHMENSLDLNEHLVSNPAATFFVRVQGNSMRDAGIQGGDILVVDRSITPGNGQIVIAMLDGDFTVKRLRKRGNRIFLEAENADFAPIEITESQELTVWGVVTFVIHPAR